MDTGLEVEPTAAWLSGEPKLLAAFPTPPPAHVYSLLRVGADLYAGTSSGLYRGQSGNWIRQDLPSQLPVSRPNGFAEVNGTYVVGGMEGLFIGRPGHWKQVCQDSIRQVARVGSAAWVVHGNGALDKVEPQNDRLAPDVLSGSSKRPWTSCIGQSGGLLLFGGLGGWTERTASMTEHFPTELTTDVVTAIIGRKDTRWIGTEQSGVFRWDSTGVRRWNPGNGLTDTWVTSLCHSPQGLIIGTLHAGLFQIVGDQIESLNSPTKRVTQVGLWKGALIVGGMDGAWIQHGKEWVSLGTNGEETTSISAADGRLVVTTARGIYLL